MMHHHHLTPFWTAVLVIAAIATFTPWGRLRNALRRLWGVIRPSRQPQHGPAGDEWQARRHARMARNHPESPVTGPDPDWEALVAPLRNVPQQQDGSDR